MYWWPTVSVFIVVVVVVVEINGSGAQNTTTSLVDTTTTLSTTTTTATTTTIAATPTTAEHECPAGYWEQSHHKGSSFTCNPCPPGTFSLGGTNVFTCTTCSECDYIEITVQAQCTSTSDTVCDIKEEEQRANFSLYFYLTCLLCIVGYCLYKYVNRKHAYVPGERIDYYKFLNNRTNSNSSSSNRAATPLRSGMMIAQSRVL